MNTHLNSESILDASIQKSKLGEDVFEYIKSIINIELLNKYPIGSVYISISNVSPSTFIGGVWEQIKDTFLLAAGDIYGGGNWR